MRLKLLVATTALVAGPALGAIVFKEGWDSAENSDVRAYTKEQATAHLRSQSEDLKKIIDGPAPCVLEVTKGCHDRRPGKAHFTINGAKSKPACKVKTIYVGSKSDHEPAC
jgi:hypothetical protein